MTTFTSNRNEFSGKVHSNKNWQDKNDYNERSGCGGYVLLAVLIVVAIAIFTFIAQHI